MSPPGRGRLRPRPGRRRLVDAGAGREVDGLEHGVDGAADRGAVAALVPRRQLEVARVLRQARIGRAAARPRRDRVAMARWPATTVWRRPVGERMVARRAPLPTTARDSGRARRGGAARADRARCAVASSAASQCGASPPRATAARRGSTATVVGRACAPAVHRDDEVVARAGAARRRAAAASRGSPSARRSACSARTPRCVTSLDEAQLAAAASCGNSSCTPRPRRSRRWSCPTRS